MGAAQSVPFPIDNHLSLSIQTSQKPLALLHTHALARTHTHGDTRTHTHVRSFSLPLSVSLPLPCRPLRYTAPERCGAQSGAHGMSSNSSLLSITRAHEQDSSEKTTAAAKSDLDRVLRQCRAQVLVIRADVTTAGLYTPPLMHGGDTSSKGGMHLNTGAEQSETLYGNKVRMSTNFAQLLCSCQDA